MRESVQHCLSVSINQRCWLHFASPSFSSLPLPGVFLSLNQRTLTPLLTFCLPCRCSSLSALQGDRLVSSLYIGFARLYSFHLIFPSSLTRSPLCLLDTSSPPAQKGSIPLHPLDSLGPDNFSPAISILPKFSLSLCGSFIHPRKKKAASRFIAASWVDFFIIAVGGLPLAWVFTVLSNSFFSSSVVANLEIYCHLCDI
ncbi:bZIP transcription factor [Histoplasma ohiense]|nr:bZIP transcription factor [Histoplasma ohiense (nom. inval.)]